MLICNLVALFNTFFDLQYNINLIRSFSSIPYHVAKKTKIPEPNTNSERIFGASLTNTNTFRVFSIQSY